MRLAIISGTPGANTCVMVVSSQPSAQGRNRFTPSSISLRKRLLCLGVPVEFSQTERLTTR
eukprot:scaffold46265_cov183-Amphora_coffeaeformis.AAC.3